MEVAPGGVIALNRAVAHGMASGPDVGLALVEEIDGLGEYHLYHATRGDLLRRLERYSEAAQAYALAVARTDNAAERGFLERRARECAARAR